MFYSGLSQPGVLWICWTTIITILYRTLLEGRLYAYFASDFPKWSWKNLLISFYADSILNESREMVLTNFLVTFNLSTTFLLCRTCTGGDEPSFYFSCTVWKVINTRMGNTEIRLQENPLMRNLWGNISVTSNPSVHPFCHLQFERLKTEAGSITK